jgi:hypothetical protein
MSISALAGKPACEWTNSRPAGAPAKHFLSKMLFNENGDGCETKGRCDVRRLIIDD